MRDEHQDHHGGADAVHEARRPESTEHLRERLRPRLVGDDQLFVEAHAGRLVCRAPATITGLAEVPGLGPRPLPFEPACVIDLHIRLLPAGEIARFQEDASDEIAGCVVPRIDLAERNVTAALPAVMARMSIVPFL